ncbi:MAG: CDP-alcohol phosphatidyltransferase family protein [Alphaproteobacteria bacterium]
MLDIYARRMINKPMSEIGGFLYSIGVTANTMTLAGFCAGLGAMVAISQHLYLLGLALIVLNRLCDGLDGGIARHQGLTDLGGYLDIVVDFIVYAGVVFAFALAVPENALWASFLIFSYIGATCSFLTYAVMAAKRGMESSVRGKKSLYYLGGLCEGTETFIVMAAMCMFPNYFPTIAIVYGVMCWITCAGRTLQAFSDFGRPLESDS